MMHTKVVSFEVIHFKSPDLVTKEPREVILVYALGEDGVVYEFNGSWLPLAIDPDNLREYQQPPIQRPPNRMT